MDTKKCAAWDQKTNIRCSNSVLGKSLHCSECRPMATKLYLNYKSLSDKVDKLDINKPINNRRQKIKHLRKCHNRLVKAYNARLEYRNVAIAPELYDFGHNLQFQILQQKIDKCLEVLNSLKLVEGVIVEADSKTKSKTNSDINTNSITVTDSNVISDSDDDNNDDDKYDEDYKNTKKQFEDFSAKRRRDAEETERLIAQFIADNIAAAKEKEKIVKLLEKLIRQFTGKDDVKYNCFFLIMINNLCKNQYFESEESKFIHEVSNEESAKVSFRVGTAPTEPPSEIPVHAYTTESGEKRCKMSVPLLGLTMNPGRDLDRIIRRRHTKPKISSSKFKKKCVPTATSGAKDNLICKCGGPADLWLRIDECNYSSWKSMSDIFKDTCVHGVKFHYNLVLSNLSVVKPFSILFNDYASSVTKYWTGLKEAFGY